MLVFQASSRPTHHIRNKEWNDYFNYPVPILPSFLYIICNYLKQKVFSNKKSNKCCVICLLYKESLWRFKFLENATQICRFNFWFCCLTSAILSFIQIINIIGTHRKGRFKPRFSNSIQAGKNSDFVESYDELRDECKADRKILNPESRRKSTGKIYLLDI